MNKNTFTPSENVGSERMGADVSVLRLMPTVWFCVGAVVFLDCRLNICNARAARIFCRPFDSVGIFIARIMCNRSGRHRYAVAVYTKRM